MSTSLWDALSQLSLQDQLFFAFALLVAFAFEFINGFHDTANAVTTVIYTKTLNPNPAVLYSGVCNFLGVLLGGTAVAFAIVNLLPVDLLIESASTRADRDGPVAAAVRRDLEPGDVVVRLAGFELAHADRFDPRSRPGQQPDHAGQRVGRQLDAKPGRSACRCSSRPSSDSVRRRVCCWS